jgi:GcrA cell cycle regulator
MAWTDERIALLTKLWTDGYTASQIAGQFGDVTRNAVIGKVHRLGLSGRAATSRFRPSRMKVRSRPRTAELHTHMHYPTAGNTALQPVAQVMEKTHASPMLRPLPRPLEAVAPACGELVGLLDLTENGCRWPVGDPQHEDFGFCGSCKTDGSSYCEHHTKVAYQPARRRHVHKDAA